MGFALADGDDDRAWTAADETRAWPGVAGARNGVRIAPSTARRRLYRPSLQANLHTPNTRLYPGIARTLATMRRLYAAADLGDQIDAETRALREQYRRRPALMRELDAHHLP